MEISMFEMWLFFTFLPNLGGGITNFLLFISVALSIVLLIFCVIVFWSEQRKAPIELTSKFTLLIGSAIFLALLQTVTPSKQEMAAIIVVPAITQNKSLQKLGTAGTDMLTEQFKQWTKEIMSENKKKKSNN